MSRRISVFTIVALTTGSVACGVGCSSTDSSDAPHATAASELSAVTDAKIRASVLKAARIVASCASHAGDALDAGCVSRAAKDTAAPSEVARKAADLTHDQICAALPASGRLYYVISSVSWQGNTTVFPDWEFYVNGSRYAEWDAVAKGYGPTDLGFPRFWKKTVFSGSL